LLKVVADALAQFKGCAPADWFSVTDEVIDMVQNLENMLDLDGIINEERLGHALKDLCVQGKVIREESEEKPEYFRGCFP
jgi:hypothetical protein